MDINELMKKINENMEKLDLVSARRLIENNLELISENRHLLRRNARSLFEILKNNTESAINTLTRKEMNVIYSINAHASNFDIRGLKLSIKNNPELLIRKDIKHYLNEDAKTLLMGIKVINTDE
ncbi:hypothetical protein AM499_04935 [Bacillus sp. FJAT-22090]|uniref:hypothetical protein n=1 Tax=Bacillus sp. FJAT-22090 TaxID=1581038 RepID=UPI0006AED0FD|nr:hypothetical protein [Bacillus sp. FJAT-22090]ALC85234.1 hypothetical protein AM499_04935 [Bacillus sp. FJAT-22090]